MGGVEKKREKKFMQGKMPRKKGSCKEEGKKKKLAEGWSNPGPCYININDRYLIVY